MRLATRGSPLALRQAALVAELLAHARPGTTTETVVVHTEGDRRSAASLDQIGGQGVFTKEVQAAVLDGRADVAVHSAKDLPPVTPDGLVLAAVPRRADPRDVLVGRALADLPAGAVVATGSARRRSQLANLRPDLTFVDLRGNMARRLAKADDGAVHAVVVAAAALERLDLKPAVTDYLSPTVLLPQVGQGALALECRADDQETADLLAAVDVAPAHRTLVAERAFLAGIGGSCAVPVAGWAELPDGDLRLPDLRLPDLRLPELRLPDLRLPDLRLHGLLASGDGRVVVRAHRTGDDPEALGRALARQVLEECGGSGIEGWR